MRFVKITIISGGKPGNHNLNDLLQWFGASLGLFNVRDRDSSCFRIFIILVRDLKEGSKGLTSDEIAELTGLTRGTVVHHLNKLMESGLIISAGGKYYLKVNNLEELVDDVESNVLKTLAKLRRIGKEIDGILGL